MVGGYRLVDLDVSVVQILRRVVLLDGLMHVTSLNGCWDQRIGAWLYGGQRVEAGRGQCGEVGGLDGMDGRQLCEGGGGSVDEAIVSVG